MKTTSAQSGDSRDMAYHETPHDEARRAVGELVWHLQVNSIAIR